MLWQSSAMMRRASRRRSAPNARGRPRRHLALELLEVEIEVGQRVVLDVARAVAQRLELGQALGGLAAALRRSPASAWPSESCRLGSASAASTLSLEVVGGGLPSAFARIRFADRRPVAHAGQHFGDVAHPHRRCPRAAACRPCSSGSRGRRPAACRRRWRRYRPIFSLDHGVRDFRILDAEGAAEAAADFRRLHLAQLEAVDRCRAAGAAAALTPSSRRPEQES